MTENKGDLISREALKEKFRNVNEGMFQLSRVFELIDNAPTVEPEITEQDIKDAIRYGFVEGYEMAQAKYQRPQGEWIDCGAYYKCPFCENLVLTVDGKPKFCDECGADMRGKEE